MTIVALLIAVTQNMTSIRTVVNNNGSQVGKENNFVAFYRLETCFINACGRVREPHW